MRLLSPNHWRNACYYGLRWLTLAGGALLCAWVLHQIGAGLPWREVELLAGIGGALRLRLVVQSRGEAGGALLFIQGASLTTIALLRDGPAAALAVSLLLGGVTLAQQCWVFRARRGRALREALLAVTSDLFYRPALAWLGGSLYVHLGGITLRTLADSGRFFQDPEAVLLPMLGVVLLQTVLGDCLYSDLLMVCKRVERKRLRLLEPMTWFADPLEMVGGGLALALWTAWGWATVPFALLMNEAVLYSARAYFAHRQARQEALSDPLTGLASWRGLDNYLRRRLAALGRRQSPFALLFLDADGLKQVNDRFGHGAGNALLELIGATCRLHARAQDCVARRGGDEFVVVLDGLERAEAETVMARLQQAIDDALAAHSQFGQAAVGVSVGLAMYPDDGRDSQTLMEIADSQMYIDKRARRAALLAGQPLAAMR